MIVFDAHSDSPSQMYRLRDFGVDNKRGQVDFPKMKRGGVDASFFAVYVSPSKPGPDAYAYTKKVLAVTEAQVAANPDKAAFAKSRAEIEVNKAKGLISVVFALENGSPIQQDINILHELYERGIRSVTLTHSRDNQICDSTTGKGTWGGLSPFGKELIQEMNRIGMIIDLAHCSDNTIYDVLKITKFPVAFTHGNCRALARQNRNLPDELIKGIAETGGVIGMSIYPGFISEGFNDRMRASKLQDKLWIEDQFIADPGNKEKFEAWWNLEDEFAALARPGVERVVDHIDHAIAIAGIDHVGIGTDYDGIEVAPKGMETIAGVPLVWEEMRARGYSEEEVSKVAGNNFLGLLDAVRPDFR